jgi:hypothetical protein
MKRSIFTALVMLLLLSAGKAQAVPVLQVGAPGSTAGTYLPYINSSPPAGDSESAIIQGSPTTLLAAGTYQQSDVLQLGSKYLGGSTYPYKKGNDPVVYLPVQAGKDWSALEFAKNVSYPTAFDTHGAILVVSVPDGSLNADGTLKNAYKLSLMNGSTVVPLIHTDASQSWFPNNHTPVGGYADGGTNYTPDFLFFDIGSFAKGGDVPNFADPADSQKPGEVKNLSLTIEGFDWSHFDLIALQTSVGDPVEQTTTTSTKVGKNTKVLTTTTTVAYLGSVIDKFNPPSHDVTWHNGGGGGGGGGQVPEPGTIVLLGSGLVAMGLFSRRFRKS